MVRIDIQMPEGCKECPCYVRSLYGLCNLKKEWLSVEDNEKRPSWCPLKEIILCKECRSFDKNASMCIHLGAKNSGNGFCSDGKRRED